MYKLETKGTHTRYNADTNIKAWSECKTGTGEYNVDTRFPITGNVPVQVISNATSPVSIAVQFVHLAENLILVAIPDIPYVSNGFFLPNWEHNKEKPEN